MKFSAWTWRLALLLALPLGFGSLAVGCNDGGAEDFGEKIDEAGDDVEDAVD
jgi:hypothetical protein